MHRYTSYQKPLAYAPGGYEETVRTISTQIQEVIGPISSLSSDAGVREDTDYLPRHCFIPTISALDLDPGFLRAAWARYRSIDSWQAVGTDLGGMTRYWRSTVRDLETGYDAYFQEDFLDYDWVRQYLGTSPAGLTNIWRTTDASIWSPYEQFTGKASPFDYLVVQNGSLAHTSFDLRTGIFLIGRILAPDCDTQPSTLPLHMLQLRAHMRAQMKALTDWRDAILKERLGDRPIPGLRDPKAMGLEEEEEETTTETQRATPEQIEGLLPPLWLPPIGEKRTRPDERKLLAELGLEPE